MMKNSATNTTGFVNFLTFFRCPNCLWQGNETELNHDGSCFCCGDKVVKTEYE